MELAICEEDIGTTKGAKSRERHETGHLVNGIEVGGSVECGACSVLRVPWNYVSRFTFHVSRFTHRVKTARLRWHSNYLHLELSFDDKLARCQQII